MAEPPDRFLVARNPDSGSSLPDLLRLPIEGGVLLKARERWPATSRVYCHPLDAWPADARRPVDARAPGSAHRDLRALYVRLPAAEFDDLARAAFELGASKRELVGALIRTYVDPHTPAGLAALQELLVADEPNSVRGASPDREQAR